jgi:hypothetical protein
VVGVPTIAYDHHQKDLTEKIVEISTGATNILRDARSSRPHNRPG